MEEKFLSPVEQEQFTATPWTEFSIKLTRREKEGEHPPKYVGLYRTVDISKQKVTDTVSEQKVTDIALEQKKGKDFDGTNAECTVKNTPQTLCLCGGHNSTMGGMGIVLTPTLSELLTCSEDVVSNLPLSVREVIYASLPTIQVARMTSPRLNIGFDTEFQSVNSRAGPGSERIILSYQFACFLDLVTVLEVVFLSCDLTVKNRLSITCCLGHIMELIEERFQIPCIRFDAARSFKVTYDRVEKDGSVAKRTARFKNRENAEDFLSLASFHDVQKLVVLDTKNICDYHDIGQYTEQAFKIGLVCHTGSVDLTAFAEDKYSFRKKNGNILPYLKAVQGGLISMEDYYMVTAKGHEPYKFYPIHVCFRDTLCYAPGKKRSLSDLGHSVGIPKISLASDGIEEKERKEAMLDYFNRNRSDFLSYASNDALITLVYASRIWGVNVDWAITSTAGSTEIVKNILCREYGIPLEKNGRYSRKEFDRLYRGMIRVKAGKEETPHGLRSKTVMKCCSSERQNLYHYASEAFYGGCNLSSYIGVFPEGMTYDYDLMSAYITAMCMIPDIDFSDPEHCCKPLMPGRLSLNAVRSPCEPIFAVINFSFPEGTKFCCIPVRLDGNVIFPLEGKDVYVSGPTLYLALRMNCQIEVRSGFEAETVWVDGQRRYSLQKAMIQLARDRLVAKLLFGAGSLQDEFLKTMNNAVYGKLAQDVIHKTGYNGWTEEMENLGISAITCPEYAALTTDLVRCMLIGTMNEVCHAGYQVYSATTDGFISNCTKQVLDDCGCYGLHRGFENARLLITEGRSTEVWEIKHAQEFLLNATTRCNTGFGAVVDGKAQEGVNAHGGYRTEYPHDSLEDRLEMLRVVGNRTGKVVMQDIRFSSLKDMTVNKCDFYTEQREKHIGFDFDMKRKPVRTGMYTEQGIYYHENSSNGYGNTFGNGDELKSERKGCPYEMVCFDTVPFQSIEEAEKYRKTAKGCKCLRTEADWKIFYRKLEAEEQGKTYKQNAGNYDREGWKLLKAAVQGHRTGVWFIPGLSDEVPVKERIRFVNRFNTCGKEFNLDAWKNCRKAERQSDLKEVEEAKLAELVQRMQKE